MKLDQVIDDLPDEDRRCLLVGAGANKPERRKDLLAGGLYEMAQKGSQIARLCGEGAIQSLMELGQLYLEALGLEVNDG